MRILAAGVADNDVSEPPTRSARPAASLRGSAIGKRRHGGRSGGGLKRIDRHPAFTATTRAAPQPAAGVVFGENLQQVTNMRR